MLIGRHHPSRSTAGHQQTRLRHIGRSHDGANCDRAGDGGHSDVDAAGGGRAGHGRFSQRLLSIHAPRGLEANRLLKTSVCTPLALAAHFKGFRHPPTLPTTPPSVFAEYQCAWRCAAGSRWQTGSGV